MRTLFAIALSLFAATLITAPAVEAKRLGGGMNLGKQYSMPRSPAQTAPAAPTRPQAAAANTTRPSGASRWLGPLAGLAAGGLLASLFFGDAFEGLQVMDILLIVALVVGGILLFRAMRRGAPTPAAAYPGPVSADHAAGERSFPSNMGSPVASAVTGEDEAPLWFDSPGFVEAAKTHFIRLQAAWDQSDFRDIREYTTPQLFAELQRERERLGPQQQYTEVVRLNAEVLGVRREADMVVASVRFSGLIREEESGTAEPLDEIWHVQHPWATREGDWLIAGIQQAED